MLKGGEKKHTSLTLSQPACVHISSMLKGGKKYFIKLHSSYKQNIVAFIAHMKTKSESLVVFSEAVTDKHSMLYLL